MSAIPEQHRASRCGARRLPLIDTGHPSIFLSRTHKHKKNRATSYKAIAVISQQMLWRNGRAEKAHTTLGQISEQRFRKHPAQASQHFHALLNEALGISRYADQEIARGRHPRTFLRRKDLPEEHQNVTHHWDHLRLSTLFDSYATPEPEFEPATTFGDPEVVAATLQQADLKQPRKRIALNGHHLCFRPTLVDGETYYLPTGICRLRSGWRVFIRHTQGVWHDQIDDIPGTSAEESLREAWIYLVSQLRILTPRKGRLAPITTQRCYTGVDGGSFLIGCRGERWHYQLRYTQKMRSGRQYAVTVRYWREETLTNRSLRDALRKLAAMDTYHRHLVENGQLGDTPFTGIAIPPAFLPAEPAIPLTADDLRYEVELRTAWTRISRKSQSAGSQAATRP